MHATCPCVMQNGTSQRRRLRKSRRRDWRSLGVLPLDLTCLSPSLCRVVAFSPGESDLGSPMPLQKTTTVSLEHAASAATAPCDEDSAKDEVKEDVAAKNNARTVNPPQVVTSMADLRSLLTRGKIDHAQFKDLMHRVKKGETVTVPTSDG